MATVVRPLFEDCVYSVALRVLRDPAAAEDVLQEVFMQIWRNPESFIATRGTLGGWLAGCEGDEETWSIDGLRRKQAPTESVERDGAEALNCNLADEAERNILME